MAVRFDGDRPVPENAVLGASAKLWGGTDFAGLDRICVAVRLTVRPRGMAR